MTVANDNRPRGRSVSFVCACGVTVHQIYDGELPAVLRCLPCAYMATFP